MRRSLIEGVRPVLNEYKVIGRLPPPPEGVEWIDFSDFEKPKAKARGRPKNDDTSAIPKALTSAFSDRQLVDQTSINVNVESNKVDVESKKRPRTNDADDSDVVPLPWKKWRRSEIFWQHGHME